MLNHSLCHIKLYSWLLTSIFVVVLGDLRISIIFFEICEYDFGLCELIYIILNPKLYAIVYFLFSLSKLKNEYADSCLI
jgi:hypothetical protein